MTKLFSYLCLSVVLFFGVISPNFAQTEATGSWTQFRGQNRNGNSSEKILQASWIDAKPELMWKKELGSAFSELLISNGVVYTMTSDQIDSISGSEYVIALDEKTGNEIWKTKVDSIFIDSDSWGNGPRSTPTIDKNNIYSLSSFGKLSANSLKDGKLIWQVDFINVLGSTFPRWGFSTSPTIVDDILIMEVGGTDSRAFVAFNTSNGKVLWNKGDGSSTYSTPLIATINNQKQIIFANNNLLSSYNTKGDTLWTYKSEIRGVHVTPLLVDDTKIFVSSISMQGFEIINIENNKPTSFLKGSSMKNDYSSCCFYNGYIYGFDVAALRCISASTGEVKWTKRGLGKGTLINVDNKLIVFSDQGKILLVDAKPDLYDEKGFVQAIEGKSWTAPSFCNGKVYVRNLTEAACYKLK